MLQYFHTRASTAVQAASLKLVFCDKKMTVLVTHTSVYSCTVALAQCVALLSHTEGQCQHTMLYITGV
jgi:hypothetical protein